MLSRRGQTIPFWTLSVAMTLALLFFVMNYANTIRWNIRAQNAADSAAAAGLSIQANTFNEMTTILYATAVDEVRIRYLAQAILNTINGIGGCNPAPGGSCDQDYASLVAEFYSATAAYTKDVQLIGQADQLSQGGQEQDAAKAIAAFGKNCGQAGGGYDCNFTYTVLSTTHKKTGNAFIPAQVDVVACHAVPYVAPQIMRLATQSQFRAIGRGAASVVPATQEAFSPGVALNPATSAPYQPKEPQWASAYQADAYTVDFSTSTMNLNFYTAGAIRGYTGTATTFGC